MKNKKYIAALLLSCTLGITSCVDTDMDDALEFDKHYLTPEDADNAVLGAYSSFMRLADQLIVLNELRGDLLGLTTNATKELQEIDAKNPSASNRYADPTAYYNVILNCNDALANFDVMLEKNRLTQDEYNERYSDLLALRSYVYLQLAAQFGSVPYVTDPVVTVDDMHKVADQEKIGIDKLLDILIDEMENSPSLKPYINSPLVQYNLDGYDLSYFFINKNLLLGDLYLWRGKDQSDYVNAAKQYRIIMDTKSDADATQNCYYMKVTGVSTWATETQNSQYYYQIFFLRYLEDDVNSYYNQWRNMFADTQSGRRFMYEWAWAISYDAAFAPTYPLFDLFAPSVMGGDYLLKPSEYAVNDLFGSQKMQNGFTFDGRGEEASYYTPTGGEPIVYKYLYDYTSDRPYEKQGRLMLYRAGLVHLRYAEAANRAGYPHIAYALVNKGIPATFGAVNIENPHPFDFDARFDTSKDLRQPWRYNIGVRGRAYLESKEGSEFADKTLAECTTLQDSILVMEKIILDEAALECAFEGNRFPDLVRVAHRLNKEQAGAGSEYMQAILRGKYEAAGRTLPDYSDEANWFLPFKD